MKVPHCDCKITNHVRHVALLCLLAGGLGTNAGCVAYYENWGFQQFAYTAAQKSPGGGPVGVNPQGGGLDPQGAPAAAASTGAARPTRAKEYCYYHKFMVATSAGPRIIYVQYISRTLLVPLPIPDYLYYEFSRKRHPWPPWWLGIIGPPHWGDIVPLAKSIPSVAKAAGLMMRGGNTPFYVISLSPLVVGVADRGNRLPHPASEYYWSNNRGYWWGSGTGNPYLMPATLAKVVRLRSLRVLRKWPTTRFVFNSTWRQIADYIRSHTLRINLPAPETAKRVMEAKPWRALLRRR